MKINELLHSPVNTPEANLTTALELIRQRYRDRDQPLKISTKSLINLVLNTDKTFDYNSLVQANNNNPAIKNLIKSFNKDYVELQPVGDEGDEDQETVTNTPDGEATQAPVDTVDNMAARAAKQRGAPIA